MSKASHSLRGHIPVGLSVFARRSSRVQKFKGVAASSSKFNGDEVVFQSLVEEWCTIDTASLPPFSHLES
jgi:hypothetical protein